MVRDALVCEEDVETWRPWLLSDGHTWGDKKDKPNLRRKGKGIKYEPDYWDFGILDGFVWVVKVVGMGD